MMRELGGCWVCREGRGREEGWESARNTSGVQCSEYERSLRLLGSVGFCAGSGGGGGDVLAAIHCEQRTSTLLVALSSEAAAKASSVPSTRGLLSFTFQLILSHV